MAVQYAWIHFGICSGLLLVNGVLLASRRLWLVAAGLYLLNVVLVGAYIVVDQMTGAGFNEAALYYVLNASWKDVGLLTAYDAFVLGVPLLVAGVGLFVYGARKVRLPKLLPLSWLSQLLLVVSSAALGLYMTPLAADVSYAVQASGLDKKDRIGLQGVLSRVDQPQTLPGPKKNLIVVYAESLEQAFFDERLFPGLMPHLNHLAAQGVWFDHIQQAPMSDWTIAGMIATQCGLPLSSHRLMNEANDFGKFSNGHQCLSNHLAQQGYWRVFMGGASNQFAGKGDYYRSMGFDEILGLDQLAQATSPQSKWGLYDDELLPRVQNKIKVLRGAEKRPFALFALTLDTHPPAGYASPTCGRLGLRYAQGEYEHLDALHCTDVLLSQFLEKVIRENRHDSTIVLLSDHVMMNSQASLALGAKAAVRRNHMVIWDLTLEPKVVVRQASQFDIAPTVLQVLLGESYRVGFGSSMLDPRPNLTEQYGSKVFDESVRAWRTESWSKW